MHINAYEAQPLTTTGCWVGAEQVVMTLLLASTVVSLFIISFPQFPCFHTQLNQINFDT